MEEEEEKQSEELLTQRSKAPKVPYAGLRRPATCCTGLFERGGFLARK